jgi:hypothetical protein
MGTTDPFRAFGPDALQIMGAAFDSAWHRLASSGSALAAPWRAEHTREALASRMFLNARIQQPDVKRLRDEALAHVNRLIVAPRASLRAPLRDSD